MTVTFIILLTQISATESCDGRGVTNEVEADLILCLCTTFVQVEPKVFSVCITGKLMRDQLSTKTTFCETFPSCCHVNDPLTRYHSYLETSFSLSVRAVIKDVFHCSSNYELYSQHDIH